ncbi:MAG: PrsW family intramembrane metalloprotease [Dehalococcoidales bacterium]|nr:PrsW family intramembrane metalloprotease [Dehalococcoidales bacterium]
MEIIIIVMAAIAPCAFWLWLIYRGDKFKPEPKRLVIRIFFFGAIVAIPVAVVEAFLYPGTIEGTLSVPTAAYVAFVVAGFTEELGKFLVVRLGVYSHPHFEEPADGLIYSAAAALGFASLENIVYVVSFGLEVIVVRGLFSNLAHVVFSALWGYPLGLRKVGMLKHPSWTWLGLLAAMIAHGIFDFLLFTGSVLSWLVVPFFFGMLILFVLMMRHANRHSVYIEHRT